jgi:mRNA interferase MazF
MRRGDIVIIAQKGVYEGKPRPALVIQAEELLAEHPSILVCLITTATEAASGAFYRIAVRPTPDNGLNQSSAIQVDRIVTVRRGNLGKIAGHLDDADMGRVNVALALFQGLG